VDRDLIVICVACCPAQEQPWHRPSHRARRGPGVAAGHADHGRASAARQPT